MYQIAQNFTLRLILSFTVCASLLLLPGVSLLSAASQGQGRAGNARPGPKKPEGVLPDLEDVKNDSKVVREAPPPIPSTVRARRNEGKPWDGRRVGDPGTQQAPVDRPEVERQTRRAHARRRAAPPLLSEDQFIQNFFSVALLRSPTGEEPLYWNYLLRAGYNQSQTSLKLAAIELGRTLFESASYLARTRSAHDYVYDLYRTYLMREPDAGGLAYWEPLVSTNGREYVRRGFEESGEFATLLATISLSGSPSTNPSSLITARVDPRNQPGNGMLSRDANWSVSLLSLPGRNGLDLGLALSYSSMVWTYSKPYFYFDEDNGFPSPGFRLGFPTVQRKTFNAQTGKNAYLLITPSGHRVELRQTTSSTVYESADSSYLQLTETSATLLVRSTDGTQLTLAEANNEYRCTQIKDRNGNYISVNYNALGQITNITDTLSRVITFNYDSNANLISITQAWNGQSAHQWVSFGWSTPNMQYSFADATVVGIKNSTAVPVVSQVALNDASYFTFEYNNPLEVSVIKKHFGPLERNATSFVYETPSDDVHRLQSGSVSAQNWTGVNGLPAQVTTNYSVAGDTCVMTAPDGTVYKEYYGTGWQKGLVTLSEIWSGGIRQKWTTTAWTQDNTSVGYEMNPRVTETNIYDTGGNRRRTTIDYGQYAQWGLPYLVSEYAANGDTEIRRTFTDYNLSQAYLVRRIIGLVSAVHLTDVGSFQGKVTYDYDDPQRLAALPHAATQHDNPSSTARGNLTSVSQWDVTDIDNAAKKLTSYTNYFVTGTPASATDPASHTSTISYADAFSDGFNDRYTFAYPTTSTDADGNSSTVQYNFDFGATTRTQSPAPAGQTQGDIQTMAYNNLGQLERVTTVNNGAYKRFWYGPNYVASYATVNTINDELYSVEAVDGLGRVMGTASNHPGSNGGYSLVSTIYDQMGRLWQQSNPTEINSAWLVSGDDAAGIYYTQQTYDWKGRPLVTTNTDGTTKTASYSGCGCAGGEVVTLTDEVGRRQKIYSDVLGRQWKNEILNGNAVYSTSTQTLNVRDQATLIRQWAGAENGGGAYQDTTMIYDGYGRLQSKHVPEQNAGTATVYAYNPDNTILSVTDACGASATYGYNNRQLITSINYLAPSGITPTPNVTFGYDAAGNRTSMTDGLGSQSYTYNQLSRLTSETRTFSDPNNQAINGVSKTISYLYNFAGELNRITDPSGSIVDYTQDSIGRMLSATGTGYGSLSQFAANLQYRAWGGLKGLRYGNNLNLDQQYDNRLRLTRYALSPASPSSGQVNRAQDYQYSADGRISFVHDEVNNLFDRRYTFDQAGRLIQALTGHEARGEEFGPLSAYNESFQYDVFGNTTSRATRWWSQQYNGGPFTYQNNRQSSYLYDSDGRVLADHLNTSYSKTINYTYDARGLKTAARQGDNSHQASHDYDGDGRRLKIIVSLTENAVTTTTTTYEISSTVLAGQVIEEFDAAGVKRTQHVYTNSGLELASGKAETGMIFKHRDPVTSVEQLSGTNGLDSGRSEFDPVAGDVGAYEPVADDPGRDFPMNVSHPSEPMNLCTLDGLPSDCRSALLAAQGESGTIRFVSWMNAPHGSSVRLRFRNRATGEIRYAPGFLRPLPDGGMGYVPVGAQFDDGNWFTVKLGSDALGIGRIDRIHSLEDDGVVDPYGPTPQNPMTIKNASPDQQSRFNDAYTEFWKRLHDNNGKNPCADLFGGVKNAEKALKGTKFAFGPTQTGAVAETLGKGVTIDPNSLFMGSSGSETIQVGFNLPEHKGYYITLNNVQAGAFVLAHETGHRTGKLQSDGGDPFGFLSVLNNGIVQKACFSDVTPSVGPLPPGFK